MAENYKKNWHVFPGFEIELVATGFSLPVNLAFAKNPQKNPRAPFFYVTELYGQVKVVTRDGSVFVYAKDLLNFKPDHRFPGTGENGVIGICVEPQTGDLFVTMVYQDGDLIKNKLVRMSSRDGLKMDKLTTIIDDIPSVHAAHQIQAVTIGYDGKLYVNVGDGMNDPNVAQDDRDLRGKILRLNLDGTIPADNSRKGSYVFAKGLRNPFGAAWRDSNKSLYISDNGPTSDDRLARIEAGKNYGWPSSIRESSFFWWEFTQAPTAIDFCADEFGGRFKDELFVNLFGGAYVAGRSIKGKKMVKIQLDDNDKVVSYDEFVTYIGDGPASPCGLAFGPAGLASTREDSRGGLYFTDLFGENDKGNVYKIKIKGSK